MSLAEDVVIGHWRRPWNNKKETSHGGAPGTPYWASDPAGFGHVGCVYTAQGFEYDTYKVLLIRGMRGTTIFSTDRETQELLRSLATTSPA